MKLSCLCHVYAMFMHFIKSSWKVYEKCLVYEKFMQHLKNLWNINFVYDLATLLIGLLSNSFTLPSRSETQIPGSHLFGLMGFTDSSSQKNLVFWVSQLKEHNGRSLDPPLQLWLSPNASRSGWGAYSSISSVGGHWSPAEWVLHNNALELKAAFLALESLAFHQRDCHILLLLDNITAISFINNKGGTRSHALSDLALEIWTWCLQGASLYMQSIYQAPAIKRRTGFHAAPLNQATGDWTTLFRN